MVRHDPHSPKHLVTEDYEYVYAIDTNGPWALHLDHDFLRELNDFEPATAERGTHQCHHCGAHIRYAAFMRYLPTGRTIVVGETCLDRRFTLATVDFQKLRRAAELDRKAQRIKGARAEFVEANPDLAWMNDEDWSHLPECIGENYFIVDIGRGLRRYGSLSEAQIEGVRKAIARESEKYAARVAAKAAENWITVPVPEGRQIVTGTIIGEKTVDSQYGLTHKMMLKVITPAGDWKLWVTKPKSMLRDAKRGDIVTINVTVFHGDRDPVIASGKRPAEVTFP